jgi:hypothetical protein
MRGVTWRAAVKGDVVKAQFNVRFWFAAALALVTMFLAIITTLWQNWIEIVFRVDPDHGNGSFERWVVGVAAVLCLASLLLARREWKRAGLRIGGAQSRA